MNTILMILGQIIFYALLMLANEYAGFLLGVILGTISFAVWVISHIVELIEPSKVTKSYYWFVFSAWVAPLITVLGFIFLRGEIGWLQ
ncbi:hypothetical protein [Neolewinella persica]|uniref:hypothetical protein n=1 Tax=Neolewinella persica TaxID=70998 RepID=UPI00036DA891|nr:hypothetical protein [Neolewinella persica]